MSLSKFIIVLYLASVVAILTSLTYLQSKKRDFWLRPYAYIMAIVVDVTAISVAIYFILFIIYGIYPYLFFE